MRLFIAFVFSMIFSLPIQARDYHPVFSSIYDNNMDVFKKHIKSGGDVNLKNSSGESLLLAAIDNSRYEMVLLLLQAKALIGMKEISHSLARGEKKIYKLFYLYVVTLSQNDLDYLLLTASEVAYEGYLELAEDLTLLGANPTKEFKGEICPKTAIGQALFSKNNSWSKDADIILKHLISTESKTHGLSEEQVFKKYGELYQCNGN